MSLNESESHSPTGTSQSSAIVSKNEEFFIGTIQWNKSMKIATDDHNTADQCKDAAQGVG